MSRPRGVLLAFLLVLASPQAARADGAALSRSWTLYVVPYSHLDVGFTQTQAKVLARQKENIRTALGLIEETAAWPEGSRFKYLIETSWPLVEFLRDSAIAQAEKDRLLREIEAGNIEVGAFFINHINRFLDGESLFKSVEITRSALGAIPIDTAVIDDVCDGSGIVGPLARMGVRYFQLGCNVTHWALPPLFYLAEAEGEGRILVHLPPFIGGYNGAFDLSLVTDLPFNAARAVPVYEQKVFDFLASIERSGIAPLAAEAFDYRSRLIEYPYDALLVPYPSPHGPDNGFQDLTIGEIARDWNARHANPRIIVATPREFFTHVESKFGDRIPIFAGELGGFWGEQNLWDLLQTDPVKEARLREFSAISHSLGLALEAARGEGGAVAAARAERSDASMQDLTPYFEKAILNTDHNPAPVPFGNTPYTEEDIREWKSVRARWTEELWGETRSLYAAALDRLAAGLEEPAGEPAIVVFNPMPWERNDAVAVELDPTLVGSSVVEPGTGEVLPSVWESDGGKARLRFVARHVPAGGYSVFKLDAERSGSRAPVGEILDGGAEITVLTPSREVVLSRDPFGIVRMVDRSNGDTVLESAVGEPLGRYGLLSRVEVGPFGGGTVAGIEREPTWRRGVSESHMTRAECSPLECVLETVFRTDSGVEGEQVFRIIPELSAVEARLLLRSVPTQAIEHVLSYHFAPREPARLSVEHPYRVVDFGPNDPLDWFGLGRAHDFFLALDTPRPLKTINATNEGFRWMRGVPPSVVFRNFVELATEDRRLVFSARESGAIVPYPYKRDPFESRAPSGFDHVCVGPTAWGDLGLGATINGDVVCTSVLSLSSDAGSEGSAARLGWGYTHPLEARVVRTSGRPRASLLSIEGEYAVGFLTTVPAGPAVRVFEAGARAEWVRVSSADGSAAEGLPAAAGWARSTPLGEPICRLPASEDGGARLHMEPNEVATLVRLAEGSDRFPMCSESDGGGGGCECETAPRGRQGGVGSSLLPGLLLPAFLLSRRRRWYYC